MKIDFKKEGTMVKLDVMRKVTWTVQSTLLLRAWVRICQPSICCHTLASHFCDKLPNTCLFIKWHEQSKALYFLWLEFEYHTLASHLCGRRSNTCFILEWHEQFKALYFSGLGFECHTLASDFCGRRSNACTCPHFSLVCLNWWMDFDLTCRSKTPVQSA